MINANLKKKIFLTTLGIVIIFLNVYLRYIIKTEEQLLITWKENISVISFFFSIFFTLINVIFFFLSLIFIYNKKNIKKKIPIFFSKFINTFYWEPLEYIHDLVAPHIPGSGKFMIFFVKSIDTKYTTIKLKFYHNSFLLFSYFPQLLTSVFFFYEIVFLKKLHYFFYFILLLLVPLIFNIYLKLCKSFHDRNIGNFTKILQLVSKDGDKYTFSFKPEYSKNNQELLNDTIANYFILKKIYYHADQISKKKNIYYPYVILITSLFYAIGGIYRIFFFIFCS